MMEYLMAATEDSGMDESWAWLLVGARVARKDSRWGILMVEQSVGRMAAMKVGNAVVLKVTQKAALKVATQGIHSVVMTDGHRDASMAGLSDI